MAGLCRPEICKNSIEAKYRTIMCCDREISNNVSSVNCELFDSISTGTWMAGVMYWETNINYVEIEIQQTCNIYRSGTSYSERIGKLRILFKNKESDIYTDITSSIVQHLKPLNNNEWGLYIEKLKPGFYKFQGGFDSSVNRIDSEWFLEFAGKYTLIFKDNEYFNISDSNYDILKKTYKPLVVSENLVDLFENNYVLLNELSINKTINQETFKPMDKLVPFKILKLKPKN